MPRPTKDTQNKSDVVETAPAPVAVPAAEKKPRAPRTKKADETAAAPAVSAPAPAPVASATAEEPVDDSTKTPRVAPTRESVLAEHAEIINLVEQEITRLRDEGGNVKFLRTIVRRLKVTQGNAARVMRQKLPSARKNNNSGFLKPVKISTEMAKFTGLDPNGLHSRVDVTKYLCKYITDHNLQNPTDKRTIIADTSLAKLLGYDAKKADKPLTYPHIQSLLKTHFTSQPKPKVATPATA